MRKAALCFVAGLACVTPAQAQVIDGESTYANNYPHAPPRDDKREPAALLSASIEPGDSVAPSLGRTSRSLFDLLCRLP